jgi:hypothetical protein
MRRIAALSLSTIYLTCCLKVFFTNSLSEISLTQRKGFGRFNLAVYWKRKYRGKQEKEPWYLLTNLRDLATDVKAYKKRFGIETMFRAWKTGG